MDIASRVREALAAALVIAVMGNGREVSAADVFWAVDAGGDWSDATKWSTNALPGPFDHAILDRPAGEFTITHAGGSHSVGSLDVNEPFIHSGGELSFAGTLNLQKSFTLWDATIYHATITSPGMAPNLLIQHGGTLNTVTLATNLNLTTGNYLAILNGLTLAGSTISLGGASGSYIELVGSQTVGGSGTIIMDASLPQGSSRFIQRLDLNDLPSTLTLGAGIHVRTGNGYSQYVGQINTSGLINQGRITSQTIGCEFAITSANWTNNGVMEAKNGGILTVIGNWTNPGTITLGTGTLNLGGNFGMSDFNHVQSTGGVINIMGHLQANGGTIALSPATAELDLKGGTITNVTLMASGGAVLGTTAANGIISNGVVATDLTIPGAGKVRFTNGLTLGNGVTIRVVSTGSAKGIDIYDTDALNNATIVLDGTGNEAASLMTNRSLTLGAGMTVKTGDRPGGGFYGNAQITGALVNQGVLATTTAASVLQVFSPLTSSGTITGPGSFRFGEGQSVVTGAYNIGGETRAFGGIVTFAGATASSGPITGELVDGVPGTVIVAPGALLTSDAVHATYHTVQGRHVIRPGGQNTSALWALTIGGTMNNWSGQLDINDNALLLTVTPETKGETIARLQNLIESGRNGGSWTGNGITSSTVASAPGTTLVLADNSDLLYDTFRGESAWHTIQPPYAVYTTLFIVQARYGDASLDGKVDALDLNLLAAHWQQGSGALWSAGDFTGDGKVDALDLNVLAGNWQVGVAGSLEAVLSGYPALGAMAVPEAGTVGILAGVVVIVGRRRFAVRFFTS